jgi:hypothetical protein
MSQCYRTVGIGRLKTLLLIGLLSVSAIASSAGDAEVLMANEDGDGQTRILAYRVRLLGLPVGARSVIKIVRSGENHVVSNLLSGLFVENRHTSEFTMSQCDFMQVKYNNSGNVLNWKFNDNIEFDWNRKRIRYLGDEDEIYFDFTDETFVDKLSQYGVIECRLRDKQNNFILSYVDNTIAHYRFEVIGREIVKTPVRDFEAVLLVSTPVERKKHTIHDSVQYWLAPELGYYPLKIRSKVMGLTFTVSLNKIEGEMVDTNNKLGFGHHLYVKSDTTINHLPKFRAPLRQGLFTSE